MWSGVGYVRHLGLLRCSERFTAARPKRSLHIGGCSPRAFKKRIKKLMTTQRILMSHYASWSTCCLSRCSFIFWTMLSIERAKTGWRTRSTCLKGMSFYLLLQVSDTRVPCYFMSAALALSSGIDEAPLGRKAFARSRSAAGGYCTLFSKRVCDMDGKKPNRFGQDSYSKMRPQPQCSRWKELQMAANAQWCTLWMVWEVFWGDD